MQSKSLTSRERIIRTLRHQPVDRLPIDLGSHMSTGISMFAYQRLREHLGLPRTDTWIPDLVQCLAYVEPDVLSRLHCDCMLLEPRWLSTRRWAPRHAFEFSVPAAFDPRLDEDGSWVVERGAARMRMPANGFFFDGAWLSGCWTDLSLDEKIELYAREARRIFEETEYATNYVGYSLGLGFEAFFGGVEQGLRMLEDPASVHAENERRLARNLALFDEINAGFGRYIQLVTIGDDMGGQSRPLVSPARIAEFCMPYYERFCRHVHDTSDIKVFMHNCGAIRDLIPMVIEAGIDVLNPVQISADGMQPDALAREFGGRIVFWGGGCDTQNVLGRETPERVRAHVRELVRTFGAAGGYVCNQVHNIMGDVPPENIVAMFDAAHEEACSLGHAS
jgi:uroporphyrinogen decarboxylase